MRDTMNIPINKGNYTMEPPERDQLFEFYRGESWEKGYADYRCSWAEYPKRQYISDYPIHIDLELSTACNLKCPMCYTTTKEFQKNVGARFMEYGLFRKIIDEIAGKSISVRLSLRGEATLHPHFLDCIRYAKEKGIKEVSTLTNGSTLNRDFFTQAMDAGLDWITISVDGLGETYEKIRKPLRFEDTLQKLRDIKSIKLQRNLRKPVIKVQAVWPSIKENPEAFYNTFAPLADLVAFNPLIDYLGNDNEILYEDDFSCCQLYQRLVIVSDGHALACSNDEDGKLVVGDANRETIRDIWHGGPLNSLRDIHRQPNGFMQVPICKRCYLPRLTDETETAIVNEREIVIKNYVNREQSVGS